jgi:hypothetical protein
MYLQSFEMRNQNVKYGMRLRHNKTQDHVTGLHHTTHHRILTSERIDLRELEQCPGPCVLFIALPHHCLAPHTAHTSTKYSA